ncbi:MAG: site-specific DNA-methyltransferase, partial [Bacteroidota bacterium]
VYPDDYAERLDEYQRRTGIKNEEGFLNKEDLWKKNTKENGQFHSVWLSMIYPRIFLSRTLLKEDGVIFVSIDDTEAPNLRLLLDSIFGSENYLASIVIDRNRKNDARFFSVGHEYMLVYAKNKQLLVDQDTWLREAKEGLKEASRLFKTLRKKHRDDWGNIQEEWRAYFNSLPKSSPEKKLGRFSKIESERGPFRDDGNISWPGGNGPKYEVLHPVTKKPCKVPDGGWRYSKPERFWEEVEAGKVGFGPDETTLPRQIRFLFDADGQVMPSVFFSYAQTATLDFLNLMGARVFENPKNWEDIKRMIQYVTSDSDIILDFFAGSGTTAHAVYKLNNEEKSSRKYICVQIPEETDDKSEARKAGYETISDLAKARINKVIQSIEEENAKAALVPELFEDNSRTQDLGFKSFRLAPSNFKTWRPDTTGKEALIQQLDVFQDSLKEENAYEALVYELLLKSGLPLTAKIENQQVSHEDKETSYHLVHAPNGDQLVFALASMNAELIQDILSLKPKTVITLDSLFDGDDAFMTNTHLQLKEAGIDFKVI